MKPLSYDELITKTFVVNYSRWKGYYESSKSFQAHKNIIHIIPHLFDVFWSGSLVRIAFEKAPAPQMSKATPSPTKDSVYAKKWVRRYANLT